MTYSYVLYGLTISLPFPCLFLSPIETGSSPDVTVAYGAVPIELADAVVSDDTWETGFSWQAATGRFLLKASRGGERFLVEDGNRVTVYRNSDAEDERILFHLLHSLTAALFLQRGFLVLHACAVNTPAGAIALCGKSMAGKSTTLAAMLQRGCEMISDDITILRHGANNRVEAMPGAASMYLWDDAAQGVGLTASGVIRHPMRQGKAVFPAMGEACRGPALLKKLYILESSSGDNLSVSRLEGADKFKALMECIYGPLLREERPGLFALFSSTAQQADIFRIQRPEARWTVDEVVKVICG
jgi:hypothetical protein